MHCVGRGQYRVFVNADDGLRSQAATCHLGAKGYRCPHTQTRTRDNLTHRFKSRHAAGNSCTQSSADGSALPQLLPAAAGRSAARRLSYKRCHVWEHGSEARLFISPMDAVAVCADRVTIWQMHGIIWLLWYTTYWTANAQKKTALKKLLPYSIYRQRGRGAAQRSLRGGMEPSNQCNLIQRQKVTSFLSFIVFSVHVRHACFLCVCVWERERDRVEASKRSALGSADSDRWMESAGLRELNATNPLWRHTICCWGSKLQRPDHPSTSPELLLIPVMAVLFASDYNDW